MKKENKPKQNSTNDKNYDLNVLDVLDKDIMIC